MNPVLLAFALGMLAVCAATLIVEHVRSKSAGAAVDHGVPSSGPAPGAGAPPVSPRSGAPTIATANPHRGDASGQAGGAAAPHPPKLYHITTDHLGHGDTTVIRHWWCQKPDGRYEVTAQNVTVHGHVLVHDIYAVRPL